MLGIRPPPELHPNIRYVDKVSVVNAIGDWGPPPVVKLRSRGSFTHACWVGSVDGEIFDTDVRTPFQPLAPIARKRRMIKQIEDWSKDNLAEPYLIHHMSGAWCFRILLMTEMDAFRFKMRWGGEQFAHVEFREPELIETRRIRG
jgi:hypothetical protein